eukprot:CAMPEP_0113844230 /NCGR_PEP_ID=MMETSP0372-20130328/133_1 /TAXON_ID=340204 /ORGANISM="Lankesteria abbotti" /LENGTH=251 /DNA_ID=CAMNT_0000813233 /DNA_START=638 /DNA_END=1394 /DNA_ORIENTATION=- /assembly_acc=CAM_ASM_000359
MSIGGHPQSRGHPGQGSQPTADPEWQEKLLEFHLELSQERCVPSASLSNQPKFKWKSAEDALCANFMGFSVMMAFAAVLADVNETGRQSFQSIRLLQSHILQLRDSGNHDVADELEFYLDMACLVKKRPPPKTAGGDCSSEVTRGTADGNGSQASRNFSSFFSSKPALTEKSDRLDLAWMRNCYDEDDRRLSGDNIAIPPPPLSDVLKFSSPGAAPQQHQAPENTSKSAAGKSKILERDVAGVHMMFTTLT